jgi:hypothetical protein
VWACEVIYNELGRGDAVELKALRAAGHVLVFPRTAVKDVASELFEPRRGPSRIVEVDLAKLLPAIGDYDPSKVAEAFGVVRKAVEAWPADPASGR